MQAPSAWARLTVFAVALLVTSAAAAPPPEPTPPVAGDAEREQARREFDAGIELFRKDDWEAALGAFRASSARHPTRAALKNVALCLRRLGRHDEASEAYEELLGAFPELGDDERAAITRNLAELAGRHGLLVIRGAPADARIGIDGRPRALRADGTLRVLSGKRAVTVYAAGFLPYEAAVDVAARGRVELALRMAALGDAGRLVVGESAGSESRVYVDNVAVGTTPWEGLVPAGIHGVWVQGSRVRASPPHRIAVTSGGVHELTLRAESMDAALRIEAEPAEASLSIDGVGVGRGPWEQPLRSGRHRVGARAAGHADHDEIVELAPGDRRTLRVRLDTAARRPDLWAFELAGAFALSPALGGDVTACAAPCARAFGLGGGGWGRAEYELGRGIGVGVFGGYLALAQSVSDRTTQLHPVGLPPNPGSADDELLLHGPIVGGAVSAHLHDPLPVALRLSLGSMIGSLTDRRTGTFTSQDGSAYELRSGDGARGVVIEALTSSTIVAPEVQLGFFASDAVRVMLGATAMVVFTPAPPTWPGDAPLVTPDGRADPAEVELVDRIALLVLVSAAARYGLE